MTTAFCWSWRHLWLYIVYFNCATAAWPRSSGSTVQLVGLFDDAANASATTEVSVHSRAMFQAAVVLAQQYNITVGGQYIEWQSIQTGGNTMHALRDVCQAVSTSNIVGVVGPALSREAHQIADFAHSIGIPVISHAATDPELSDSSSYPTFYRTVPSDAVAALAMVKLFLRYNWTSCLVIYQNDAFGSGGAKVIGDTFPDYGLTVTDLIVFDVSTLKIRGDLKSSLARSTTRIIVLWALASYASIIIESALNLDVLGPQFTWILSSSVPLATFTKTHREKLIGMFALEPITGNLIGVPTNTTLLDAAYRIWKQHEPDTAPELRSINSYALFAFDATWSLIQSLQNVCTTAENNGSACISLTNASLCFDRRLTPSSSVLDRINSLEFLGVSGPVQFNLNSTDRVNGLYYYARNVQYSSEDEIIFNPVLTYAYRKDWRVYSQTSVIVWPGNSLTPPTGIAKPTGVTLRIGVIESIPFTVITNMIDSSGQNTTKLVGYVPDLIELLRSSMGFVADIQLAPANQSYSALIQSVVQGVYDIVIGDVTVTSKRREIVSFSNSIFDNSLRIVMRKTPDVSVDLFSYLKPFSRSLWLMLLGATVFASVLLGLIERQTNEALRDRSLLASGAMSFWFAFGTILGYGVDFHVGTVAGRVLTAGLYILSLVLVASYTANLASDLTIAKSEALIAGIDDLKSGKIPFGRIGIRTGTAVEEFYLREISGGSRNFYTLKSRKDLYDSLLSGVIDASFMDIGVGEYVTNNIYCNLTLIGEDLDKGVFGVVVPKQWLYQRDLDVTILSLRESGTLDDLKQKWFQTRICSSEVQASTAMSVGSMGGLLLTFAIISGLAVGLFLWKGRRRLHMCLRGLRRRKMFSFRKKNFTIPHVDQRSNAMQNFKASAPIPLPI